MIARILIPLLLVIILPDVYLWCHRLRKREYRLWERVLWMLPGLGMTVFTMVLAMGSDFVPADISLLRLYIALLGVLVIPKFLYVSCAAVGLFVCRRMHSTRNWGKLIGLVLALSCLYVFVYGYTVGPSRIRVNHVDIYTDRLPAAFNGFRIAHFSDAHVGTYAGKQAGFLQRAVDSIMAQRADVICFTGDLQNVRPDEIYPVRHILSRLTAPHGVFSVLGNHDYSKYITATDAEKRNCEREMIELQRRMGWKLLLNRHEVIRRNADSIFIAGMENDGEPPFHSYADVTATTTGIPADAFTVMLEHDPSSWVRTVLPNTGAQLTLSGHTHGGQVSLFGLRATRLRGKHDLGLYRQGNRYLYVSAGLGGVVPFRFGIPPEITVYTLYNNKQ